MPRMTNAFMATVLLTATIFVSGPALAQDESTETSAGRQTNVLLTVRLGRLEGGKPTDVKSYDLVVVSGGPSSRLLSGARVPFPATAEDRDADDHDMGRVTYVYQNIGFTTEAHAWVLADGRIKLVASLEDSFVKKSEDPAQPPYVETRQLSVNAILTPGKPMEVTRVEGIRESSGFVEIEAKVLD